MKVFQNKTRRRPKKTGQTATSSAASQKNGGESLSLFFSLIAVLISLASIYLQFFYEKYELSVSVIESNVENDSLQLSLLYNNKGNQDATVISSEIYFYSGKDMSNRDKRLYFIQGKQTPEVLSPNKQVHKQRDVKSFFKEVNLQNYQINPKDTIKIGLDVRYLNENTLQSQVLTQCGWLTLNENYSIDLYWIDYMKIALNNTSYFSSGYSSKINEIKVKPIFKTGWIDSVPTQIRTK